MSWREDAACFGVPVDVFFLPEGARGENKRARVEQAKRICRGCPVRRRCAEYGQRQSYGIWGGLTPEERKVAVSA